MAYSIHMNRNPRALAGSGLVLVAAIVVLIVTEPFVARGSDPRGPRFADPGERHTRLRWLVERSRAVGDCAAEQGSAGAVMKVKGDQNQVSSAEKQRASTQFKLSTARSSAAAYGRSSTFTKLPSVGEILSRGESVYEISGEQVMLLYGSVFPTRAFLAGMPPGPDVAD